MSNHLSHSHFYQQRQHFFPLYLMLHKTQESVLHRILTATFSYGTTLHTIYVTQYRPFANMAVSFVSYTSRYGTATPHQLCPHFSAQQRGRSSVLAAIPIVSSSWFPKRHWPHLPRTLWTRNDPARGERLSHHRFGWNNFHAAPSYLSFYDLVKRAAACKR